MLTALICIALLALLVFGLGFMVSLARKKTKTVAGCPDDPSSPLYKAVRAHGNTIEYAPMLAIIIYCLGTLSPAFWLQGCMVLATASRYLLAYGLLVPTMSKPNRFRFLGALGTYVFGFVLSAALLLAAFSAI
jgi:uncharacterized membrane protein YecN with MAPEG domain